MIPGLGFLRSRQALGLLASSFIALGAAVLGAAPALAQSIPANADRIFTGGPIKLQDGESLGFGMLVPAVQKVREAARFVLTDGQGKTLFSHQVQVPPGPSTSVGVYVKATFHAKGAAGANGGSTVEIDDGSGAPAIIIGPSDGILIGLLLPAVQRNGQLAIPLAASMQSFNVNGGTMTHTFLNSYLSGAGE
jgi:hypothetical protein